MSAKASNLVVTICLLLLIKLYEKINKRTNNSRKVYPEDLESSLGAVIPL